MNMQWQNINAQTHKMQDELIQVKEQLEYHKKKSAQSKTLFDEVQLQKTKIREQEKQIEKYRIEVLELQVQAQQARKTEEDDDRRVRSMKQERCASQ